MTDISTNTIKAIITNTTPTFKASVELMGANGKEIELQVTSTHIQWRLTDGTWANLIALADITGADSDMLRSTYDINNNGIVDNAEKVNNHTVATDVPSGALFTDTVYTHPNHSGDVTSVADGAQTIANGAVTLAKMANMATGALLGRTAVGTGSPEVLIPTVVRNLLNIQDGANNYSLPTATGSILGGVKVGSGLDITSSVLSTKQGVDGWASANETWEYVSVDDPTGVIRVNADVTTKYCVGLKIKFTNGGNVIYGIITAVGSYSGGYTSITFLHEIDPTDSLALHLMANSAITANYYSNAKVPFGFPIEENKWTVYMSVNTTNYTATPTNDTWYNNNSVLKNIPIGYWNLGYVAYLRSRGTLSAGTPYLDIFITLSTTNNSESNANFTLTNTMYSAAYASKITDNNKLFDFSFPILVTTKTPYYLLCKYQSDIIPATMGFAGTQVITKIKAVCKYL